MGRLVWHDLARLVAMAASTYGVWAGVWGLFFRKFAWDFIGGRIGPAGIIPGSNTAPFVEIVVTLPIVQIIIIVNGLLGLAWEWPVPSLARLGLSQVMLVRTAFYLWCAFWASLLYQSMDSAVYFTIAAGMYLKSHYAGEIMPHPDKALSLGQV